MKHPTPSHVWSVLLLLCVCVRMSDIIIIRGLFTYLIMDRQLGNWLSHALCDLLRGWSFCLLYPIDFDTELHVVFPSSKMDVFHSKAIERNAANAKEASAWLHRQQQTPSLHPSSWTYSVIATELVALQEQYDPCMAILIPTLRMANLKEDLFPRTPVALRR